jgi:vacuolar protein sorting-associated protein 54
MLRDAEYFKTRIGGLDGAGDTGDYIVNLVKEKNVPKPKAPAPLPPPEKVEATMNGKKSTETPSETTVERGEAENESPEAGKDSEK